MCTVRVVKLLGLLYILLISACTENKKKDITINFVGDVLLDRGVRPTIKHKGGEALFQHVDTIFKNADFTIANLECPVTKIVAPIQKRFVFRAEPEYLPFLKKAGITHLNMANNHSNDQGRGGLLDTYQNIIEANMTPIGGGINHEKACEPVLIEQNGLKIALFSSVILPLETWSFMEDKPCSCQNTIKEITKKLKLLKATEPNTKIVVQLHWGAEFQFTPTSTQIYWAHQLIDAGCDLIIGHHPHVVQTIETYKGKKVYYSIGNFVFDQTRKGTDETIIVSTRFTKDSIYTNEIPCLIDRGVPKLN